jgi:hypothetical protein
MARQSELDELRKEVEALRANNPLSDIQNTLNESVKVDMGAEAPVTDEPRAGEFQVTESAAPPETAAPQETAAAPAPSETQQP